MASFEGKGDFRDLLAKDKDVARVLSAAELDDLFDLRYHTKHVDTIFARVFGPAEERVAKRRR
jgi:adenylosuccinate lyase